MNTNLIIIGGGAAGLMAGCNAAEQGIDGVIIERKHRPGRKLLLCGNNRCNLTSELQPENMLSRYGKPVQDFLFPAITSLPARKLMSWFHKHSLRTTTKPDKRVYPRTEKADDVLHMFTDFLRDKSFPVLINSPVKEIKPIKNGFEVICGKVHLTSRFVLIATGGVSYPKTGSVGDGQKFARSLGHKVTPYKPGLVGFEIAENWLCSREEPTLKNCNVKVISKGKEVASTRGIILFEKWGVSGQAILDASRIIAKRNIEKYIFNIDLCPVKNTEELAKQLINKSNNGKDTLLRALSNWLLPQSIAEKFITGILKSNPASKLGRNDIQHAEKIAKRLKNWELHPLKIRSLKEAIVTVGGVSLDGVNPKTMESRKHKGLYFAGEVLDIDGPTGGFNLQAAFSTAQLAIKNIKATS